MLGTTWSHTPQGAQEIVDEFTSMIQDLDGFGIFMHNLLLTLPMFLPFAGAFWGSITALSTGFTLSAIATVNPEAAGFHPLSLLYMTPFGIMELIAYSLAISRGALLSISILKKRPMRPEIRPLLYDIAAAAGLLISGGLIEHFMIELIQSGEITLDLR